MAAFLVPGDDFAHRVANYRNFRMEMEDLRECAESQPDEFDCVEQKYPLSKDNAEYGLLRSRLGAGTFFDPTNFEPAPDFEEVLSQDEKIMKMMKEHERECKRTMQAYAKAVEERQLEVKARDSQELSDESEGPSGY